MDCTEARKWISSYLDGELPDSQKSALEQHLAHCEACRAEMELSKKIKQLCAAVPAESVPDTLLPRIAAEISGHKPSPFGDFSRYRRKIIGFSASAVAVAAAFLFVFSPYFHLYQDLSADIAKSVPENITIQGTPVPEAFYKSNETAANSEEEKARVLLDELEKTIPQETPDTDTTAGRSQRKSLVSPTAPPSKKSGSTLIPMNGENVVVTTPEPTAAPEVPASAPEPSPETNNSPAVNQAEESAKGEKSKPFSGVEAPVSPAPDTKQAAAENALPSPKSIAEDSAALPAVLQVTPSPAENGEDSVSAGSGGGGSRYSLQTLYAGCWNESVKSWLEEQNWLSRLAEKESYYSFSCTETEYHAVVDYLSGHSYSVSLHSISEDLLQEAKEESETNFLVLFLKQ